MAATAREQQPFLYGSLSKEQIYLKDSPTANNAKPDASAPVQRVDPAAQAWGAARDTTSVAVLEEFVCRYGDSFYARLASARIEELKKTEMAAAVPPVNALTAPPVERPPVAGPGPGGTGAVTVSFSSSRDHVHCQRRRSALSNRRTYSRSVPRVVRRWWWIRRGRSPWARPGRRRSGGIMKGRNIGSQSSGPLRWGGLP